MTTLIARLKHPEQYYEFTDPKKANAVLMSLCQEAADALEAPVHKPYRPLQDNGSQYFGDSWDTLPTQSAPNLQAELDATNRQVEILSDALAESRREVAALKINAALDKKAENARELGLDYEPVTTLFGSLPVYDTTPPAAQRQWVGLTPHERMMCRSYDIDTAIDKTEAKLKEKNT